MNRSRFVSELEKSLAAAGDDERREYIAYYSELIDDKIEDGLSEEEAVASLIGDLDELRDRYQGRSHAKRRGLIIGTAAAVILTAVWLFCFNGVTLFGHWIRPDNGPQSEQPSITDADDSEGMEMTENGGYERKYTIEADFDKLGVSWLSGHVEIVPADGDKAVLIETSDEKIPEKYALTTRQKGGELEINEFKNDYDIRKPPEKWLQIQLPEDLYNGLSELDIDATSADVSFWDMKGGELSICTVSGGVECSGVFDEWEIDTTSGGISLVPGGEGEIQAVAVSGDISIEGARDDCEASTVSGRVTISPAIEDFEIEYETVSGRLDSGRHELVYIDSGHYISGDGGISFDISTVSGDIKLA